MLDGSAHGRLKSINRQTQGRGGEAMQLALEALPDETEARRRPLVREAQQSLLQAFYQYGAELVIDRPTIPDGDGWGDDNVMFSADGTRLTTTAADGSATIVLVADGSPLRSWLGEGAKWMGLGANGNDDLTNHHVLFPKHQVANVHADLDSVSDSALWQ